MSNPVSIIDAYKSVQMTTRLFIDGIQYRIPALHADRRRGNFRCLPKHTERSRRGPIYLIISSGKVIR